MKKIIIFVIVIAAAVAVGTVAALFVPRSQPPVMDIGNADVPPPVDGDASDQVTPSSDPVPT